MAESDDTIGNAAAAPAQAPGSASARKSALRRKVVGGGQTSLSSPARLVLPSEPVAISTPAKSASSPDAARQVASLIEAPAAEATPPVPVDFTPVQAAAADPAPSTPVQQDGAAAVRRGVGRPRKEHVAAASVAAKPIAGKPTAKSVVTKSSAARPIVAKPGVSKPVPVEAVAKAVAARVPPVKISAPPVAVPASATKVAAGSASAAAAARPPLRATRITKPVHSSHSPAFSIKDITMDMSANFSGFQGAMSEAQAKAQAAFEKSSNMLGEAGQFAKGNVEAIIESGKILAEGAQEIGSSLVAESRTAFEAMTGDIKELAAAKSPADFLKLQSDLARKSFDNAVAYGSKNSEAMLKLMNDVFAPISGRVSLAVEKARQVAPLGVAA
jgi:phasin family protein